MATISRSFGDEKLLKKATKEKKKRNVGFTAKDAPLKSKRKSRKITKETNCSEPVNSKNFAGIEQEAEWNHAFSEELCVPVPDLYPELSDSLANLQHRDTEQDQMAKVRNEDEDNVQCVPNTFDDHGLEADNNNPGTSQSQSEFQMSSPHNQTQNNTKGKRKLTKPRKVAKSKSVDQGEDTGTANEEGPEKQGTWAQCSIPSCHKWRFLQDSIDPNEIPERWVCSMNENDNYNTCSVSQETFDSQDGNLNVMYTPYPRGAIVWAKLVGYPWWPAMMEDDPDFGYYCETDDDGVTPVMYHVVFFDKEVSRTWVNAFGIRNFSIHDDPEDMGKVACRGKNYRRQVVAATTEARRATQMPLEVRLAKYGFAARYKGPMGTKTIEEKESLTNSFDDREFSDSESSSQEIYSSGNSYGTESNSSSSSDELKTSLKSSTHKDKPAKRPLKGKRNKSAEAKDSDSSAKKLKESRERKAQAKKDKKLSGITRKDKSRNKSCDNEDFKTQHVRNVSETSDERSTEEDLQMNAKYTSVCGTKELQTSDSSVLHETLDSKQTASGKEENIKKPSKQKSSENGHFGTQTVKKRRVSSKVEQGVKKRNNGEVTQKNFGNNLDSIERKDKEVVKKVVTSSKLSIKAPKKKRASKEGQGATDGDAKIYTNPTNDTGEDKEISTELSISNKSKLCASKEKQGKREPHKGVKSTSQCPLSDINKNEDKNGTSNQSLDSLCNTDKEKSKQPNSRKNQSKKLIKKKSSSLEASGKHEESKVGNEENKALRTEVAGGAGTLKDHIVHSENRKPSFVLKRSPACTDLRVSKGQETSEKRKLLPKLKKVFKPPVAKVNKIEEVRKLPNLLTPHFVSPARTKLEHTESHNQNADGEETTQSNIVMTIQRMKEIGTKRKASNFDQYHGSETQKKTKDDKEKSDVLSEDLQAEISEIDDDIANIQEQLGISDTSNTSISEEKYVSAATDQQCHPDSPEF